MTADGFRRLMQRAGESCDLPDLHPHMLRHSCGFALANRGKDVREIQDYLGHKNIQNTVGYPRCGVLYRKTSKSSPGGDHLRLGRRRSALQHQTQRQFDHG